MTLISPARFGAITLLLCSLACLAFTGPANARPVPASVQTISHPDYMNGVLISVHGGGWIGDRDLTDIRHKMSPFVQPAVAAGWAAVHVSYSTGAANALADIHEIYDRVRDKYGSSLPVCLLGNSAGGHLALTYAGMTSKMPGVTPVDCVIASAPPTDILAFRREVALKPYVRKRRISGFLNIGFRDARQMHDLSPVRFARSYASKTLLFTAVGDPVVSSAQVLSFSAKLDRYRPNLFNREVFLPGGSLPFVHRRVSATAWHIYREQVRHILSIA